MISPKKKPTGRLRRQENARRKQEHPERPAKKAITKLTWEPGTMLSPVPAVMISCGNVEAKANIITVAWAGTVCSDPPMLSISVRPERYSYDLIKDSGEFVVNIPSLKLVRAMDYCGCVSGRKVDKFAETKLTPGPAQTVRAPIIMESPVNIECVVRQTLELGTHVMFVAEVTAVQVTEEYVTASGRLALEKPGMAAYAHGGYYVLGKKLGSFGYSVRKPKSKPEPKAEAESE